MWHEQAHRLRRWEACTLSQNAQAIVSTAVMDVLSYHRGRIELGTVTQFTRRIDVRASQKQDHHLLLVIIPAQGAERKNVEATQNVTL